MKKDKYYYRRSFRINERFLFVIMSLFITDIFFSAIMNISQLNYEYLFDGNIRFINLISNLAFIIVVLKLASIFETGILFDQAKMTFDKNTMKLKSDLKHKAFYLKSFKLKINDRD